MKSLIYVNFTLIGVNLSDADYSWRYGNMGSFWFHVSLVCLFSLIAAVQLHQNGKEAQ
jgi:hypothetical protein